VIDQAVHLLRAGRLVAFPTETVYGLGADATSPAAVRRIFAAKGRPATNPLIVHVADADAARRYATAWPAAAEALAAAWWPGPLTLVLPKHPSVVDEVSAGLGTVGLRVPNHPVALDLLRAFGGAVAAPSANRSNHVSPTTARHVRDELGDAVDLVLDGGPCAVGIESTVLDLTGDVPTILRPGGISREQLASVVGPVAERGVVASATTASASPGQHAIHYAPTTPTVRFETPQRGLVHPQAGTRPDGMLVLSSLRTLEKHGPTIAMPNDPPGYARHLYAALRELDGMGLRTIYVEMPPDEPAWAAVRDRLRRATTPLLSDS
jgi:L-threonylcarbamoyladenylate synthase